MKTEVTLAEFTGPAEVLQRLQEIAADLASVGHIIGEIKWTPGGAPLEANIKLSQIGEADA
jgi:hypothetical protein